MLKWVPAGMPPLAFLNTLIVAIQTSLMNSLYSFVVNKRSRLIWSERTSPVNSSIHLKPLLTKLKKKGRISERAGKVRRHLSLVCSPLIMACLRRSGSQWAVSTSTAIISHCAAHNPLPAPESQTTRPLGCLSCLPRESAQFPNRKRAAYSEV